MTAPRIPPNAYTNAPGQHSNLILGSLQLLFWLVLHPSAWENHIHRLDPSLNKNFSLLQIFTRQRWRQWRVWYFFLQGIVILPCLASLVTGFIFLSLGIPLERVAYGVAYGVAVGVAYGVAGGVAVGVAGGVAGVVVGVAYGVAVGVAGGVALGVAGGVALSVTLGVAVGVAYGVAYGVAVGVAYGVALSVAGGVALSVTLSVAGGVAYGVALGVAYGVAVGVGVWVNWWRPVLMSLLFIPWHFLLYRMDQIRVGKFPSLLHKHLAFWDEWQYLPIWGLDKHLLLVLERSPVEGQAALNYLSTSRQRWAAQSVQIELDARQLEQREDANAIGQIHRSLTVGELEGPADALFRSFNRLSEDVEAALNQSSAYNQRLALNAVADRLDGLLRELTRSSDKYAVRFRPIAQRWSRIIALHLDDLTKAAELRQEIDSPYIIGVPLTERQEIFVGRTDISSRIEQLLRDHRRPPLLLYGQRRTGKTSLLNNLGRLLPSTVIPMFVDLQGPASRASNHAGFLYNLARGMADSAKRQRTLTLPALSRESLSDDPFTRFDEWLDEVDAQLQDNTALLELDEFEVLDQALAEGRFSETAVLGMLRNLIQHRPRFKVLLSGSHNLEEFQRWSSYLINAQVIHLGYLQEAEARQLIEHPVEGFALRYELDASQRVLDLTHGHPFLVQLLCAEIVALKNEQDPSIRRLATLADVESAIPEALSSGSMFFSDIERNQIDTNALSVLRYLAAQGEGATLSQTDLISHLPEVWRAEIDRLLERELIELAPNGYRFQVELIRRWFTQDPSL